MQRTLFDLLDKNHILLNLRVNDSQEAIQQMTTLLVESSHVEQAFAEDVWEREKTYPTGLPTQPHAVAIPHADPDHVNQSAVCFGTLQGTVPFAQMGTEGSTVLDVKVIVLLAIKEREKQADLIKQVVNLIQNREFLQTLVDLEEVESAFQLIKDTIQQPSNNQ